MLQTLLFLNGIKWKPCTFKKSVYSPKKIYIIVTAAYGFKSRPVLKDNILKARDKLG